MELSILDANFRRSRLVSSWNSLVWAERYSTAGDFELTSNNIGKTLELLRLDTPVAIRDSSVPMIVESQKIEKDARGVPQIVVTGRSYETVMDRRIPILAGHSNAPRVPWNISATSPSIAAAYIMQKVVTDGTPTVLDKIPEITILNEALDAWPGGSQQYVVEPKELYEWVIETLKNGSHGLRSVLPQANSDVNTIQVSIYKGVDRRTDVVFQVTQDRFDKATYLMSKLGHKNVMITETKNGIRSANTGEEPKGLDRRVAYQDLSSEITLPAGTELDVLATNKGIVSLAELLPIALFSGEISAQQAARYNYDYFLGDQVTLKGEYGLKQDVRVAEFVRVHDLEGERSYPAFEATAP